MKKKKIIIEIKDNSKLPDQEVTDRLKVLYTNFTTFFMEGDKEGGFVKTGKDAAATLIEIVDIAEIARTRENRIIAEEKAKTKGANEGKLQ